MAETRFSISYSAALRPIFTALGLGSAFSGLTVGTDDVVVRMGWGFRVRFPRSAVRSVRLDHSPVLAWGAHGWAGRWLVNGSSSGIVRFELEPPARGLVTGIPVRVSTLRVSLDEPNRLVEMLGRSTR